MINFIKSLFTSKDTNKDTQVPVVNKQRKIDLGVEEIFHDTSSSGKKVTSFYIKVKGSDDATYVYKQLSDSGICSCNKRHLSGDYYYVFAYSFVEQEKEALQLIEKIKYAGLD